MSFFCLLWIPLFFFFRRSVSSTGSGGAVWALGLGCVLVLLQFMLGDIVQPGGFGFMRWLSGFVDIAGLPALLPLAVCRLLITLNVLPADTDDAAFALLSLIPLSVFRSISWLSPGFPFLLVLVPLLWTAQALGIPFFLKLAFRFPIWYLIIPLALGIASLPFLAVTSWWAFFSQQNPMGFLFLFASLVPAAVSVILDCLRKRQGQPAVPQIADQE